MKEKIETLTQPWTDKISNHAQLGGIEASVIDFSVVCVLTDHNIFEVRSVRIQTVEKMG